MAPGPKEKRRDEGRGLTHGSATMTSTPLNRVCLYGMKTPGGLKQRYVSNLSVDCVSYSQFSTSAATGLLLCRIHSICSLTFDKFNYKTQRFSIFQRHRHNLRRQRWFFKDRDNPKMYQRCQFQFQRCQRQVGHFPDVKSPKSN
jgi:hypothetical protein